MHNPIHKIFSIPVSDSDKISMELTALNTINKFLCEPNIVYINHSISVLTNLVTEYQRVTNHKHYIIVSLIYKDLSATEFDLSKTSKKTNEIVKKSIAIGDTMPMPEFETAFDKKIKERKEDSKNI